MAHARRAIRPVLLGAGATLLLAAALWRPVAVPLLVKFPTDLDQTARYEGTFTLYVEPGTEATIQSPIDLPLELERRIRTVPEESGARTVVVQELVTFRIGGTEQRETHQYVMDRRSMANRDDPRSFAYDPANVVDRSGTYRVNLPLGTTQDGRYEIWENEPGQAFPMEGLDRRVEQDGLSLVEMEEVFDDVPVAPYYEDELRKQGFALEITFGELTRRLEAAGVDVDGALAALPESDTATVADVRTHSLPLRFFRYNDGRALVEPRTGTIVDLLVSDEGIAASVDVEPLAPLRQALARNTANPAIAALAHALDDVESASPTRVYHLHYGQTAASVREVADLTADQVSMLDWITSRVPLILAAAGLAVLMVSAVLTWRRRVESFASSDAVSSAPRSDGDERGQDARGSVAVVDEQREGQGGGRAAAPRRPRSR